MQNTPNFGLRKPDYNEFADVMDLNYNADIIDTTLENHQVDIDSYNQAISDLNANTQKATQAEALLGNDNNKIMTPLRVLESIRINGEIYTSSNVNDLNLLTTPGKYFIQAAVNPLNSPFPEGFSFGVEVKQFIDSLIVQEALSIGPMEKQTRYGSGSSFDSWKKTLNQSDYDQLFQYVSNGKSIVATAITDKGIQTDANASFATMASNISLITSGGSSSGTMNKNITNGIEVTGLPFTPKFIFVRDTQDLAAGSYSNGRIIRSINDRTLNVVVFSGGFRAQGSLLDNTPNTYYEVYG